jgi:hypothetical protein
MAYDPEIKMYHAISIRSEDDDETNIMKEHYRICHVGPVVEKLIKRIKESAYFDYVVYTKKIKNKMDWLNLFSCI